MSVTDILAVIQGPDVPGDAWRIVHPFRRLQQAGYDARYVTLDGLDTAYTNPETTVLVMRGISGTSEDATDRWLAEWRQKVRAVIFEYDDVFYGPDVVDHLEAADFMRGKSRDELLQQGEAVKYFASQCDGVIVSSEPLAETMRQHTSCPVIVVPNALDTRWFRCKLAYRSRWADRLTVGWCGGRRPEADVVPMAEAWGRIARWHKDVRFVLCGALIPDVFFREVDLDRIIHLPWHEWDSYPEIYQVDVGCVAVADTPFSRAKTPIKAWEYALAGAAVIGTDLLYGDCVKWGGLFADTVDAWEWALRECLSSQERRRGSAATLTSHVERYHALDVNLMRWPAAFNEIVAHQESQVPAEAVA